MKIINNFNFRPVAKSIKRGSTNSRGNFLFISNANGSTPGEISFGSGKSSFSVMTDATPSYVIN